MRLKSIMIAACCGVACGAPALAGTLTLGFQNITGNSATDAAIGESQLRVTISMVGADVNFRFFHDGGMAAAAIAQIYFDDRSPLLGAAALTPSGAGVAFTANGAPPVLPGGNTLSPAFVETRRFTANSPPPMRGISPGEHLDIKFGLLSGDYDAVIADLVAGDLRIGIHVIAFASGGSESFVNDLPPDMEVIPLPTPLSLAGAGLLGLAAIRRRR